MSPPLLTELDEVTEKNALGEHKMVFEIIVFEKKEGIVTITLNRPERKNAEPIAYRGR